METDRYAYILNKVADHYEYLQKKGYEVVFTALQGSQNYELDEYTNEYMSDVDTKSIVLPKFEDFVAAKQPISATEIIENTIDGGIGQPKIVQQTHAEVKDVRIMLEMFLKENISYIELLYSKYVVVNPKYQWWYDELIKYRDEIAYYDVKQFAKCLAGMAYEKQKALCHPYPAVADKIAAFGYDGKQLSHAARLLLFITMWRDGIPISACYDVPKIYKDTLMNYKKQLDENGNVLSCESAIARMEEYVKRIDKEVDDIVNNCEFEVNTCVREFLERMKILILKEWFREQLDVRD